MVSVRTLQVYEAVQSFIVDHGYVPSYRELARMVGLKTPSAVSYHLDKLVDAGLIERRPGTPRSLVVVKRG
jgi:repressor LexA